MSTDPFWTAVSDYLTAARSLTGTAETIILTNESFPGWDASSAGEAFFPGSGGDDQLCEALDAAGWTITYLEGDYFWIGHAPDGTYIKYTEGDIDQATAEEAAELTRCARS